MLGIVYLSLVCYNLNIEGGDAMLRARRVVNLEGNELLNSKDNQEVTLSPYYREGNEGYTSPYVWRHNDI